jgi:hypothetical protein
VSVAQGRTFTVGEDLNAETRSVLLSHGLWQRRFGGDRNLLGKMLILNGNPCTIIGIMPPGFLYLSPRPAEIWNLAPAAPLAKEPRRSDYLGVIGRHKKSISLQQAGTDALRFF